MKVVRPVPPLATAKVPKFTAQHRLRIKIADLDGVGRIAGEILSGSNMLFQSVSFGLELFAPFLAGPR